MSIIFSRRQNTIYIIFSLANTYLDKIFSIQLVFFGFILDTLYIFIYWVLLWWDV